MYFNAKHELGTWCFHPLYACIFFQLLCLCFFFLALGPGQFKCGCVTGWGLIDSNTCVELLVSYILHDT